MAAEDFTVGDLVWAKMKGFTHWPARIVEPPKDFKKGSNKKVSHYVFFFGTNDHAWIPDENILMYEKYKEVYSNKLKTAAFQSAVKAIFDYSQKIPKKDKPPALNNDVDVSKTNGLSPKNKPALLTNNNVDKKKVKKRPKSDSPVQNKRVRKSSTPPEETDSSSGAKSVDNFITVLESPAPAPDPEYPVMPVEVDSFQTFTEPVKAKASDVLSPFIERPKTPPLEIGKISEALRKKNIEPSKKKLGFIGLGIMGRGIVKNLLHSGHHVTIWNRTPDKCIDFVKAGAKHGQTPADVVQASDITFCCVSDPRVIKELMFGNCGVLQGIEVNKCYVEMSSIDPDTSQDLAEAIVGKGGKYLEAPLNGSRDAAEEGTLIVLAAGDRALFQECESCFHSIGQHAYYLGSEVGNGSKMNLILNMILGSALASLAEAFSLAQKHNLCRENLLEVIELGNLCCPALVEKGHAMIDNKFQANMPLQHMQKDLHLVLGMGHKVMQPLPLAAAANEIFKHAKMRGYSQHDVCAVSKGVGR